MGVIRRTRKGDVVILPQEAPWVLSARGASPRNRLHHFITYDNGEQTASACGMTSFAFERVDDMHPTCLECIVAWAYARKHERRP